MDAGTLPEWVSHTLRLQCVTGTGSSVRPVASGERPTVEELVALGLYDPDGELAAERLALIEYLFELGATVDELLAAHPDLASVASTRALRVPASS